MQEAERIGSVVKGLLKTGTTALYIILLEATSGALNLQQEDSIRCMTGLFYKEKFEMFE